MKKIQRLDRIKNVENRCELSVGCTDTAGSNGLHYQTFNASGHINEVVDGSDENTNAHNHTLVTGSIDTSDVKFLIPTDDKVRGKQSREQSDSASYNVTGGCHTTTDKLTPDDKAKTQLFGFIKKDRKCSLTAEVSENKTKTSTKIKNGPHMIQCPKNRLTRSKGKQRAGGINNTNDMTQLSNCDDTFSNNSFSYQQMKTNLKKVDTDVDCVEVRDELSHHVSKTTSLDVVSQQVPIMNSGDVVCHGVPNVDGIATSKIHPILQSIQNKSAKLVGTSTEGMYGENRMSSLLSLFWLLQQSFGLNEESVFLDIGSGRGVPSIAAAVYGRIKASIGIELDDDLYHSSLEILTDALWTVFDDKISSQCDPSTAISILRKTAPPYRVSFISGDALLLHTFNPATHIYSFDVAIPPYMIDRFVNLFNQSTTAMVYMTFRRDFDIYRPNAVLLNTHPMYMVGSGERHTIYIYVKISALPLLSIDSKSHDKKNIEGANDKRNAFSTTQFVKSNTEDINNCKSSNTSKSNLLTTSHNRSKSLRRKKQESISKAFNDDYKINYNKELLQQQRITSHEVNDGCRNGDGITKCRMVKADRDMYDNNSKHISSKHVVNDNVKCRRAQIRVETDVVCDNGENGANTNRDDILHPMTNLTGHMDSFVIDVADTYGSCYLCTTCNKLYQVPLKYIINTNDGLDQDVTKFILPLPSTINERYNEYGSKCGNTLKDVKQHTTDKLDNIPLLLVTRNRNKYIKDKLDGIVGVDVMKLVEFPLDRLTAFQVQKTFVSTTPLLHPFIQNPNLNYETSHESNNNGCTHATELLQNVNIDKPNDVMQGADVGRRKTDLINDSKVDNVHNEKLIQIIPSIATSVGFSSLPTTTQLNMIQLEVLRWLWSKPKRGDADRRYRNTCRDDRHRRLKESFNQKLKCYEVAELQLRKEGRFCTC